MKQGVISPPNRPHARPGVQIISIVGKYYDGPWVKTSRQLDPPPPGGDGAGGRLAPDRNLHKDSRGSDEKISDLLPNSRQISPALAYDDL